MRIFSVALFCLALTTSVHAQYTVETVPNPKESNNTFVSNPDGIISAEAVDSINVVLTKLEQKNGTQVAVVALNSIGDADIFDFAQSLFERWGIGQRTQDNGLLVLLVVDKRTVRFHTGSGLEGVLPDVICKRIQRDYMVPYFKKEDYASGMREGIRATVSFLTDETFASSIKSGEVVNDVDILIFLGGLYFVIALIVGLIRLAVRKSSKPKISSVSRSMKSWWLLFLLVPTAITIFAVVTESYGVFFLGLYGLFALTLLDRQRIVGNVAKQWESKKDYREAHDLMRRQRAYFGWMSFLFPLPSVFAWMWARSQQSYYRAYPRNCNHCGAPAKRLTEQEEDAFLSKSQQLEEQLKSVDYDVWHCTSCEHHTIETFENPRSKYDKCPSCKVKAYYYSGSKTLISATYSSTGLEEKTYLCKNCGKKKVENVVLPILVRSSSSGSSGGGSSSGGSFGGGSSGGGGASSSW